MRALVLDDEKVCRTVLTRMLEDLDYAVVEAADGAEGLERMADKGPFQIALVDWMMPNTSGLEFVKAVRANHEYDDTLLVMVTAKHEVEDIQEALSAGATEYIMKPVEREALEDKLRLIGVLDG